MTTTQEKIELSEQTPLKSDTDAQPPATGTESAAEGATPAGNAAAKEKKRFGFFAPKKTKTKEEGDVVAPSKDVEAGEGQTGVNAGEAKKKTYWWQRKPCPTQSNEQCLSYGVNLVQRDDHNLQSAIDLGFEDIYGEPDSVHSLNGVWRSNAAIFQAVRSFFYKVFSLILAIPLAVVFGVLFALVSALSVFLCIPAGRLLSIPANWFFKLWRYVISNTFDPIAQAIGHMFANVKVTRYGLNMDPTSTLTA